MIIAPCGMNCSICSGYLRQKNPCLGCTVDNPDMPAYCASCKIRNCTQIKLGETYCDSCSRLPCKRLKELDKRYRTRYGMSMLENLENIRVLGIDEFARREEMRWKCTQCGGVICVHKGRCIDCGHPRS